MVAFERKRVYLRKEANGDVVGTFESMGTKNIGSTFELWSQIFKGLDDIKEKGACHRQSQVSTHRRVDTE